MWHKRGMGIANLISHLFFAHVLGAISLGLTWLMIKRVRILDHPNERSSHSNPTPRSGGIAIVMTFFIGLAVFRLMGDDAALEQDYFWTFAGAAALIAVVSIFDDLADMSFRAKLGAQAFAAIIVMAFGVVVDQLYVPGLGQVQLGVWGYALTFLWIVGLTNAFNFMDGIDGIAAGTALVASVAFAAVTLSQGSSFIYLVSLIVAGSVAGFLFWNWQPAKIFMGDSGSQFLGFVLAVLAVIAGRFDASHTSYLVMPLLFGHFIWDTAYTFFRRLKNGERVTQAHRTHLYQLMTQMGLQHVHVTLVYLVVGVLQGLGAMMLVHLDGALRLVVFLPFIGFQVMLTVIVTRHARAKGLIA
ncbi:MAG: undecaprenyl/decaprenyl-phosphate alpha-N-acetylglucosaminyl 1-phosphate transferase [Rhodospirillales bacterium]|nr:undecaprenyl/decaprenyl-phosphate alpha-N-acetylglucosaminyl 1-phosphate transferase [Rhodospirillales bacterium]